MIGVAVVRHGFIPGGLFLEDLRGHRDGLIAIHAWWHARHCPSVPAAAAGASAETSAKTARSTSAAGPCASTAALAVSSPAMRRPAVPGSVSSCSLGVGRQVEGPTVAAELLRHLSRLLRGRARPRSAASRVAGAWALPPGARALAAGVLDHLDPRHRPEQLLGDPLLLDADVGDEAAEGLAGAREEGRLALLRLHQLFPELLPDIEEVALQVLVGLRDHLARDLVHLVAKVHAASSEARLRHGARQALLDQSWDARELLEHGLPVLPQHPHDLVVGLRQRLRHEGVLHVLRLHLHVEPEILEVLAHHVELLTHLDHLRRARLVRVVEGLVGREEQVAVLLKLLVRRLEEPLRLGALEEQVAVLLKLLVRRLEEPLRLGVLEVNPSKAVVGVLEQRVVLRAHLLVLVHDALHQGLEGPHLVAELRVRPVDHLGGKRLRHLDAHTLRLWRELHCSRSLLCHGVSLRHEEEEE